MRIALLTHQWPSTRMGGIGSYVRQSAAALAASGHEPHVFTPALDLTDADVPAGVTLHPVEHVATRLAAGPLALGAGALGAGGEGVYRLALAWLLCEAFLTAHRADRFDIVEAPEVEALGLPLLLDSQRDVPVVTHLHCCSAIAHAANGAAHARPAPALVHELEFAAIRLADGRCAPTRSVVAATAGFIALDMSTVELIPHPYRSGPAAPPPPADAPAVFVGRIERLKGCGVLAEALNLVLARNPTARFRFVGPDTPTGPGGRSMQQFIQQTLSPTVADRVEFAGQQSAAEVEAELGGAAFCVQPSLSENFSLACCEAMGAGRALIVTDNTGSAELAGQAGLIVRNGSAQELSAAMETLYGDPALCQKLGTLAHHRISRLCDPLTVSGQRVEFYQDIIDRFAESARPRSTMEFGAMAALSQMTASLLGVTNRPLQDSPGWRLLQVCRSLAGEGGAQVLLFGAGKYTTRLLAERRVWEQHGHRVVGIVDEHPRFATHPFFLELPVRSLEQVEAEVKAGRKISPIVLSTDTYTESFWEKTAVLRALGVRVARLDTPAPPLRKAA
jgi:glycogen(starch) synthase